MPISKPLTKCTAEKKHLPGQHITGTSMRRFTFLGVTANSLYLYFSLCKATNLTYTLVLTVTRKEFATVKKLGVMKSW